MDYVTNYVVPLIRVEVHTTTYLSLIKKLEHWKHEDRNENFCSAVTHERMKKGRLWTVQCRKGDTSERFSKPNFVYDNYVTFRLADGLETSIPSRSELRCCAEPPHSRFFLAHHPVLDVTRRISNSRWCSTYLTTGRGAFSRCRTAVKFH